MSKTTVFKNSHGKPPQLNKGIICVALQQFNNSQKGQVNLNSRIAQEKIADKIIEMHKRD